MFIITTVLDKPYTKGELTPELLKELSENIIYVYQLLGISKAIKDSSDYSLLISKLGNDYYGIHKITGIIRQITISLEKVKEEYILLIDFKTILLKLATYEQNNGKEMTEKQVIDYLKSVLKLSFKQSVELFYSLNMDELEDMRLFNNDYEIYLALIRFSKNKKEINLTGTFRKGTDTITLNQDTPYTLYKVLESSDICLTRIEPKMDEPYFNEYYKIKLKKDW